MDAYMRGAYDATHEIGYYPQGRGFFQYTLAYIRNKFFKGEKSEKTFELSSVKPSRVAEDSKLETQ